MVLRHPPVTRDNRARARIARPVFGENEGAQS